MYKLISDPFGTGYAIQKLGSQISFLVDPANNDYQQFIQDVAEQGYDIVEGPDVVQPSYADLRREEYPPIEDQLDKIYHSGVNAWKAQIKEIKNKYPKAITGRTDIAPLPDWVYTDVENYRFNQQLEAYVNAVERLDQRILTETQERVVDEILTDGVYYTVEIQPYIEALSADDPRVIQDEAERAEAESVIDATPQNVIDAINN
jgi:hypothetical protein